MCSNARRLSFLDSTDPATSSAMTFFNMLDYVGSPWRMLWGRGGEGDFSYRNRTAMLHAIQYKPHDGSTRDDLYFVQTLLEMNSKLGTSYRIATKEQTEHFGGTSNFTEESGPPIVASGTLSQLEHGVRETVLALCPELKLIFPVLHNPSCFVATPNGEECAKYVCALRDPNDRKGGC